jgi:hypothetical protein
VILTSYFAAATSFLPILLYTVFIYLFTRSDIINTLPQRFQKISSFTLLMFIPAIIGFNEVASFTGITYRELFEQIVSFPLTFIFKV